MIDATPERRERPRLLFLSYFFPPARTIAAVRAAAFARSLARSGWEVTVVTPHAEVWRRVEGASSPDALFAQCGIRCLRTPHRWTFLSPRHLVSAFERGGRFRRGMGDRLGRAARRAAERFGIPKEAGWRRDVLAGFRGVPRGAFDLVLATGTPFVSFELARTIARRVSCHYVLDYRDLWSGNPHAPESGPLARAGERRIVAGCALALTVAPTLTRILSDRFPGGERFCTATNGFDSEELASVTATAFDHFAIVYAGRFYAPRRTVAPVFAALARLNAGSWGPARDWRFHYYGRHSDHVRGEAKRFGLEDRVELHGEVTRAEALSAVRGAGLAVVVTSISRAGTPAERGTLTGKIFDAIGLGTPILAIGPDGSDLDHILATAGGGRRFAPDDAEGISSYVAAIGRGEIPPRVRPDVYDWKNLAPALDRLLRATLSNGNR